MSTSSTSLFRVKFHLKWTFEALEKTKSECCVKKTIADLTDVFGGGSL